MRLTALTIAALLMATAASAQTAEAPVAEVRPTAQSIPFACTDGRIAEIAFPDDATAVLVIDDGEPVAMTIAPSETGARFIGTDLQWLAVGVNEAHLSVIAEGEDVTEVAAADPGILCTPTTATIEESDEAVTDDALVDDGVEAAAEDAAAQ